MNNKTIALGSDHAGFELKNDLLVYLVEQGYNVQDMGPDSADSVDYPDFAHKVGAAVESKTADCGILICGSGNGVCITANKHVGVRAALCWETEISALAKQHNDANVICLPARFISQEKAFAIVDAYLNMDFEGGRHLSRVNKIEG
jgi:ribose 5-phosphate isomerase B